MGEQTVIDEAYLSELERLSSDDTRPNILDALYDYGSAARHWVVTGGGSEAMDAAAARVMEMHRASRSALPALVEEVRRLRGEIYEQERRIIEEGERRAAAEARVAEVERACDMPLEMIATTLDAHRKTAEADHQRAEKAESEVARLREALRDLLDVAVDPTWYARAAEGEIGTLASANAAAMRRAQAAARLLLSPTTKETER